MLYYKKATQFEGQIFKSLLFHLSTMRPQAKTVTLIHPFHLDIKFNYCSKNLIDP